jgi:hypothetical protein
MTPIFSNDEDTPDKDRLEALKAMFYSIDKVSGTDTHYASHREVW